MEQETQQFRAFVKYEHPSYEELKGRFPDCVDSDCRGLCLEPIERCKGVSKVNREVDFEYVHMDRDASNDEVLAEMDSKGLRPALYEELLAFAEKYPDEHGKFAIIALGSEAEDCGDHRVACLWSSGKSRQLHLLWIVDDWHGGYRFLAVRK